MTMPGGLVRSNCVNIDLDAVESNFSALQKLAGSQTRIFVALKANAYNFGLVPLGRTAQSAGAAGFAVADAKEAIELREAGITLPILLYSGTTPSSELVNAATRFNLWLTVHDRESAEIFAAAGYPLKVFAKFDVGLERLGVPAGEAVDFLRWMTKFPSLKLGGVYGHFHVPVMRPDLQEYLAWQFEAFEGICAGGLAAGIDIPLRMVSSTAVLRQRSDMMLDAIDPGHAVYGITAGGPAQIDLPIKCALTSIETTLLQVREITRTEFLEAAPFAPRPGMRFGVMPIGLYDNFEKISAPVVLVRGRRAPVLGASSLEHTRVDLTDIPEARVGDPVVILGSQGSETITMKEIMEHNKHPRAIDFMMALSANIPRNYTGRYAEAAQQRAESVLMDAAV